MTDRVPGAPGQYKITVSAAEAQKLLTGEEVTVTIIRDDQPLVEGTPYNKKAVLPDELAEAVCPGVLDPNPADAFHGLHKKSTPFNYARNSDFEHFIADAGVGEEYGGLTYAGNRWFLDSGTVTGEANANGEGYRNIMLNGTIRQVVENPPNIGTVGINMVNGSAQISYSNGEITISSNGGVIKNVRLFEGSYSTGNIPDYHPEGYGVEIAKSNGGALYMELLYENPTPESSMGYVTLPLPELAGFDFVELELRVSTTVNYRVFFKNRVGTGTNCVSDNNYGKISTRVITTTRGSLSVGAGYTYDSYGTYKENNGIMILVRVYGVRGGRVDG